MFDRKPLGQQTEDDLTGGTYETQVFNMYAKLRGFHLTSGNTALAIHGMRSEDAEKGSTLSDGAATGKMFDDFEYLASNGMIKSYWNDNYSLIHKVNDLLDEMSQNPSLTEGDLVNKGEALFVRAFCYFNLVRAFGEVPLNSCNRSGRPDRYWRRFCRWCSLPEEGCRAGNRLCGSRGYPPDQ